MIDVIYLDLDGVVADFEKRYEELFGMKPSKVKKDREKYFWDNWSAFVKGNNFESLDKLPDADVLLTYLKSLYDKGVKIKILSSSGGPKHHEEVVPQKMKWLQRNGINYPAYIVNGAKLKASYATSRSILIDDTDKNIEQFEENCGIGILHTSARDTIAKLETFYELMK